MERVVMLYKRSIKNWCSIKGRMSRGDFWIVYSVNIVIQLIALLISTMLRLGAIGTIGIVITCMMIVVIVNAFLWVMNVCLKVRRLHDTNHSGAILVVNEVLGAILNTLGTVYIVSATAAVVNHVRRKEVEIFEQIVNVMNSYRIWWVGLKVINIVIMIIILILLCRKGSELSNRYGECEKT